MVNTAVLGRSRISAIGDPYANTLLKHKMLFGSDYPLLAPNRWPGDFGKIAIRAEVQPVILKENALRLFGLTYMQIHTSSDIQIIL
jgi:predicted TIM-barrel fold metal-dependent hydrolase